MLTTTPQITPDHLQTEEKFKLVDFVDHPIDAEVDDVLSETSKFTAMQRRRMSKMDASSRNNDRMTFTEVIGQMECIPDRQNSFASSAIYKVCLPKNRLASMWMRRGARKSNVGEVKEMNLIKHVMFEAQIIDFRGNKAIAIYLRDMTNLMKVRKLTSRIEKLKKKTLNQSVSVQSQNTKTGGFVRSKTPTDNPLGLLQV